MLCIQIKINKLNYLKLPIFIDIDVFRQIYKVLSDIVDKQAKV